MGQNVFSSVTMPYIWMQKYKYANGENKVNLLQTVITANSIAVGL